MKQLAKLISDLQLITCDTTCCVSDEELRGLIYQSHMGYQRTVTL